VLDQAAGTQGYAAWKAEERKLDKYQVACAQKRMTFVPIVAETFGGLGDAAISVLDHLARGIGNAENLDKRMYKAAAFNRIAVTTQRHIAGMIHRRDL
jgi:hypothetical protein